MDEWGYTSLDELEAYKGPLGIGIERDLYWKEKKASEVIPIYWNNPRPVALFLGSGRGYSYYGLDPF